MRQVPGSRCCWPGPAGTPKGSGRSGSGSGKHRDTSSFLGSHPGRPECSIAAAVATGSSLHTRADVLVHVEEVGRIPLPFDGGQTREVVAVGRLDSVLALVHQEVDVTAA